MSIKLQGIANSLKWVCIRLQKSSFWQSVLPRLALCAREEVGTSNFSQYLLSSDRLGTKPEQPQVLGGECSGISDVFPAHDASICFSAAIQIPLWIFSGKARVYFGNICLAFKIAVIQLFAQ